MKNKIILITGAPGVGKTETAKVLIYMCQKESVWIDTDKIAAIHPFTIDGKFYTLLYNNLVACIANFQAWGAKQIIISGVILPSNILGKLINTIEYYKWSIYGLYSSESILEQRIFEDNKGQDTVQRLEWLHLIDETKNLKNACLIDNTNLSVAETARVIAEKEGIVPPRSKTQEIKMEFVKLDYLTVFLLVQDIFSKWKVTPDISKKVINDLIHSDIEGHYSHGLLRLHDYLKEIKEGIINIDAKPSVIKISEISYLIDGNRSFGILSRELIAKCILNILKVKPVAIVGLKNSNHIGRLHHLAETVCQNQNIILGFVNYLGAGQKVPVWNGIEGRFCTNPVLIGIPRENNPPIILDMSTSAVSEGKIREYQINQQKVPNGWLIDKKWKTVNDPNKLYKQTKDIFIAPLGGEIGYKGSALALIVDVLAGIITDAGYSTQAFSVGGNGGLFISFPINILGSNHQNINAQIDELIDYCKSSGRFNQSQEIRIPGERSYLKRERFKTTKKVIYSKQIWKKIIQIKTIL